MGRDLQHLIRGAVAYGLDAFLEASGRQNYQKTASLIGYVPPAMPDPFGTVTLVLAGASNTLSSIRMR